MEDKNKGMEEFFRNSMDQFDQKPSKNVWEGISSDLDDKPTIWQRFRKMISTLIPFLLLLLLFGSYVVFTNYSNNGNEGNNVLAESKQLEIENLKNQISDLEKALLKAELAQTELILANSELTANANEFDRLTSIDESEGSAVSKQNHSESVKALRNLTKSNNNLRTTIRLLNEQLMAAQNIAAVFQGKEEVSTFSKGVNPKEQGDEILSALLGESRNRNYFLNRDKGLFVRQPHCFLSTENSEKNIAKSRYSIGFTGGVFNTFVSSSNQLNYGSKWGIRQEFRLLPRISFTNSLTVNNQKYTLLSKNESFDDQILLRYPVNVDAAAEVERIEIKNTYVDLDVGLKYNFLQTSRRNKIFINPSVKWLLYLPQEFEYGLAQAADLVTTRNRYIAYFGSVNLAFGIERQISEKQIVQLSIWGEQSLIPLGQESQYIRMVGLQGSYLFGK